MKNIYEFDNGVTEWVIADSEEEAKQILKDTNCFDDEDIGECSVVGEAKLESHWLVDFEEPQPDDGLFIAEDYHGGYKKIATFKQSLEEATESEYFARSEE